MRLLIWNANYNCNRRTFEENAALLFAEGADLVILSETAQPVEMAVGRIAWIGKGNPGLGLMAGPGYTITPSPLNSSAPPLFGAYQVCGPVSFNLLAVWPVEYQGGASYSELLHTALDVFGEFLKSERTVVAGDFNSNSRVLSQKLTHPAIVARAENLRLKSIYHHQTKEEHGQESLATFRWSGTDNGRFHIDYCFLSPTLLHSASVQILGGPIWESRSDHLPLKVDLPDKS